MSEKLCLKWNDFQANVISSFGELRDDKDFTNVTLACEDREFDAHQWILTSCSPFFRTLLKKVRRHQHPFIYLRGVTGRSLEAMVDFVYRGEANVLQEELDSFLALAEELQLRGLTGNGENSEAPVPEKQTYSSTDGTIPSVKSRVKDENKMVFSQMPTHGTMVPMGQRTKQTVQVQVSEETARKVEAMITKQDGLWTCLVCNFKSSKNCHLKEHVEKHIKGLQYPCNYCGKVLRSFTAIRQHIGKHHN